MNHEQYRRGNVITPLVELDIARGSPCSRHVCHGFETSPRGLVADVRRDPMCCCVRHGNRAVWIRGCGRSREIRRTRSIHDGAYLGITYPVTTKPTPSARSQTDERSGLDTHPDKDTSIVPSTRRGTRSIPCSSRGAESRQQAFFRKAVTSSAPRWPREITLDGHKPSHLGRRRLRREDLIEQDHRAIKVLKV